MKGFKILDFFCKKPLTVILACIFSIDMDIELEELPQIICRIIIFLENRCGNKKIYNQLTKAIIAKISVYLCFMK